MRVLVSVLLTVLLALVACGSEKDPSREASDGSATAPESHPEPVPETAQGEQESPVSPSALAAAEMLVGYANGAVRGELVPWGRSVAYSVERRTKRTLTPITASSRKNWDLCPRGTATLEGRNCPINVLGFLAPSVGGDSAAVVEGKPPSGPVGCVRYVPPASDDATDMVWLRPGADRRDCFTDFAVAVSVSAEGQIIAVDLAASGP